MAGAATSQPLTNATGASFPVNMIDESGTGAGPFTPRHAPTAGAVTERSGSITTGGTSQMLAPANTARKRIMVFNPQGAGEGISTIEPIFIRFGASNAAGVNDGFSIAIMPGGPPWDSGAGPCPSDQINITAATAGHKFIALEIA